MTWFIGPPPPVYGTWAATNSEAWAIYHSAPGEYGYPVQVGDRWLVPRTVRVLDARLAAEAAAVHDACRQAAAEGAGTAEQRTEVRPALSGRVTGQAASRRRAGTDRQQQSQRMRQVALF